MPRQKRADHVGQHNTAFLKNKQKILASCDVCALCGQRVDKTIKYPDPYSATIDHIVPISKGGHPSDISNLQLTHRWCNRQKSDKLIVAKYKQRFGAENIDANMVNLLPLHFNWLAYKC